MFHFRGYLNPWKTMRCLCSSPKDWNFTPLTDMRCSEWQNSSRTPNVCCWKRVKSRPIRPHVPRGSPDRNALVLFWFHKRHPSSSVSNTARKRQCFLHKYTRRKYIVYLLSEIRWWGINYRLGFFYCFLSTNLCFTLRKPEGLPWMWSMEASKILSAAYHVWNQWGVCCGNYKSRACRYMGV